MFIFNQTVDLEKFNLTSAKGLQELLGKKQLRKIVDKERHVDGVVYLHDLEIVYNDNHSLLCMLDEIFVRKVFDVNLRNDQPYVIDGGANIGLFSIFIKQRNPGCEIVAFEPDPAIAKLFATNIEKNSLSGITLHEKALWTDSGVVQFMPDNSWGGKVVEKEGYDDQSLTVPCLDIEPFLVGTVDFMKLDIEGAEERVIEKNISRLTECLNYFVFEWHSNSVKEQSLGKILYRFEKAGYSYKLRNAWCNEPPYVTAENYIFDSTVEVFLFR